MANANTKENAMSGATQTAQRDIPAARPPVPPFTREIAIQKMRLIEDAWNLREPEKMALAYTVNSRWRNRSEFQNGRQQIIEFLNVSGPKNWIIA
jgi:nuclear transport factor 2 (NTF2) superfamily protein